MKRSKIFILILSIIIICALAVSCASTGSAAKTSGGDALSLWTDEAPAKKALTEYMEAITKEGSPDFIPKENRIAIFDLDGTLFCETNPTYFDFQLFIHRVTEDPTYTPTKAQLDVAIPFKKTGKVPPLSKDYEQLLATAYEGMTLNEFESYVKAFMETDQPGYENLKRKDAFYKPMLQVINYLKANDFIVYVSSGTNRLTLRALAKDALNLPRRQIIGSDNIVLARGQGNIDDLDYTLSPGEEVRLGGQFIEKNLQMNKVESIIDEIGEHPVLAFGNSMTDASMMNYALSNPTYKSMAFMLMCDDLEREYGNLKKAETVLKDGCNKYGWIPVSMKNDWKTIYGENVKKTE